MPQGSITPEEMLSLVEGEQSGVAITAETQRAIDASPTNRALYAELSASVRALREMPLRDAPASVWSALDAAYDEAFAERRTTAVRTTGDRRGRLVGWKRFDFRRVAAACLVAAGLGIWAISSQIGGDPNVAPNGLRFVNVPTAKVLGPAVSDAGDVHPNSVVYSFLTKTQTYFGAEYQGVGTIEQPAAGN